MGIVLSYINTELLGFAPMTALAYPCTLIKGSSIPEPSSQVCFLSHVVGSNLITNIGESLGFTKALRRRLCVC